jgi:hypothetical protein
MVAGWAKPVWKWLQRRRAQNWTTVQGQIESVAVRPKKQFLSTAPRGRSSRTAELARSTVTRRGCGFWQYFYSFTAAWLWRKLLPKMIFRTFAATDLLFLSPPALLQAGKRIPGQI